MLIRYATLAVTSILLLLVLSIVVTNNQAVQLNTVFGALDLSCGVTIFAGTICGGLFVFSLSLMNLKKVESQKRKLEWDAQDAKLVAEIKSDREKQLEAKISTLEAALKSALKK